MAVWRKAAAFDPALSSPMTWLIAIARNRAIDQLRVAECPLLTQSGHWQPHFQPASLTRYDAPPEPRKAMRKRSKAGSVKLRRRKPGAPKRPSGTEAARPRSASAAGQEGQIAQVKR